MLIPGLISQTCLQNCCDHQLRIWFQLWQLGEAKNPGRGTMHSHFMSFHLISSHFVLFPCMCVCVCARWRAWIACWGKVVWTGVRWNGMSFIHDVKFQGKNNGTLNLFWIKIHQRHWKAKRAKGFICEQPPPFSQAKQDWRMGDIRVIDFPSKRKERHVGENQSLREPQWRGNISRPRQH